MGRTIDAIFCAEIGDFSRFRSAPALCSWAGLAPRSPGVGHQGGAGRHHQDGLASGALGGAGGGGPLPRGTWLHEDFCGIAERRGKKKARVAVARKMLTLVYCGLRDGEIRCLRDRQAA